MPFPLVAGQGILCPRRGREAQADGDVLRVNAIDPGPVGTAEKAQPAGVGIMMDDVVAGLMAGLAIRWAR